MHDGRGCREVEPGAARLERDDHDAHGAVILKAVDHLLAVRNRDAAVQEIGPFARGALDPRLKPLAHFAKLREDEHLAVRFAAALENLEKRGALAGIGQRRFGFRILRGRIADLLEAHDELQNLTAARGLGIVGGDGRFDGLRIGVWGCFAAALGGGASRRTALDIADFVEVRLQHLAVKRRLLGRQRHEAVDRVALGQVRDDRLVGLEAAQHEGGRKASERFGCRRVAIAFDREHKGLLKVLRRPQKMRLHRVENRPVLHESVFDGRARHGDRLRRAQRFGGRRLCGGGVFNGLRFVKDEEAPAHGGKHLGVAAHRAVARENDVGERRAVFGKLAVRSVVEPDRERRSEFRDLVLPVRHERCRYDREDAAFHEFTFELQLVNGGDHLQGLPEPHVVGDKRPDAQSEVFHEPRVAACLIGAQRCTKVRGWRHVVNRREPGKPLAHALGDVDFGAAVFACERCAHLFEVARLRGLFERRRHGGEFVGVDPDEVVADANDFARVGFEALEFFRRQFSIAERHRPVKTRKCVAPEHARAALRSRIEMRDKPRLQKTLELLGQHDRNAEEREDGRRIKEKLLQFAREECQGLAALLTNVFECRVCTRERFENRERGEPVLGVAVVLEKLREHHGALHAEVCSMRIGCARVDFFVIGHVGRRLRGFDRLRVDRTAENAEVEFHALGINARRQNRSPRIGVPEEEGAQAARKKALGARREASVREAHVFAERGRAVKRLDALPGLGGIRGAQKRTDGGCERKKHRTANAAFRFGHEAKRFGLKELLGKGRDALDERVKKRCDGAASQCGRP